jgi:thioesterase domain-containing protein/acyl carrier protein
VTVLVSERARGDLGNAASAKLRAAIAVCFENALSLPDLAEDDDFFDLGGDSVAAVDLALQLQDATGVTLPMTAVFDAPSIAAMADFIEASRERPEGAPVLLKPGKATCPVFLFPGAAGAAAGLRNLARALDTDQSVYAFDTPGLNKRSVILNKVEELADYHLPRLQAARPSGDFVLAGYSLGGLVAYEIAARLAALGTAPRLVILIDSVVSRTHYSLPVLLRIWRRRAQVHWQTVRKAPPTEALRLGAAHIPHVLRDIVPRKNGLVMRPGSVSDAGAKANRTYVPPRTATPAVLLWSQHEASQNSLDLVWRSRATRLRVIPIPGDHATAITAHLSTTAAAFSRALRLALPET